MSTALNEHFKNQPFGKDLKWKMDDISRSVHPDFLPQFNNYRDRLLGIIEDPNNADVISDESVQNAIAKWNNKIGKALSWHTYSLQVEKAVTEAANNTSWEQAA